MESIDEIYAEVGRGITEPYRALVNEKNCIIKNINNIEGYLSIFNDYVGNFLTNSVGFATPNFGFCIYTDKTKNNVGKSFEVGELFFYSEFVNNPMYIDDIEILNEIEKEDLVKLIIFDYFILNEDRNTENIFVNAETNSDRLTLYPIDYTHSFPGGVVWDRGQLGMKVKNNDFESFDIYIKKNHIHQLIIEGIKISSDLIDKSAKHIYNNLEQVDFEEMLRNIDQRLINKFFDNDLNDFKNFLNLRKNDFQILIDEIKIYFKEGD